MSVAARCALLVALLPSCRSGPAAAPPTAPAPAAASSLPTAQRIDASITEATLAPLFDDLLALPRVLGDPRRSASIDALGERLRSLGAPDVLRVAHQAHDPVTGTSYDLVNLVAHLRPNAAQRFVIATHFDIRPWAERDPDPEHRGEPIPGANDGTSGLAVLFALLPVLVAELPDRIGVTAVLFDGEELGHPDAGGYCAGSRYVARQMRAGALPRLATAEFGIVLDMIGDVDLRIPIEPHSLAAHPELVARIWSTARQRGFPQFDGAVRELAIVDDHKFLSAAGVPSILIIDREYAAWHTRSDDAAHVSVANMAAVAEVVRLAVLDYFTHPPPEPRRADDGR